MRLCLFEAQKVISGAKSKSRNRRSRLKTGFHGSIPVFTVISRVIHGVSRRFCAKDALKSCARFSTYATKQEYIMRFWVVNHGLCARASPEPKPTFYAPKVGGWLCICAAYSQPYPKLRSSGAVKSRIHLGVPMVPWPPMPSCPGRLLGRLFVDHHRPYSTK